MLEDLLSIRRKVKDCLVQLSWRSAEIQQNFRWANSIWHCYLYQHSTTIRRNQFVIDRVMPKVMPPQCCRMCPRLQYILLVHCRGEMRRPSLSRKSPYYISTVPSWTSAACMPMLSCSVSFGHLTSGKMMRGRRREIARTISN